MNMKRMRGRNNGGRNIRHHGGGGGGGGGGGTPMNRSHVFDSSGPDVRVRGTAQQLFEKYLQLGRDASSASDRVNAESYFQHAEHYFRILNAMNQAAQQQQQGNPQPQQQRPRFNGPEQEGDNDGDDQQANGHASDRGNEDEQRPVGNAD
jgi:hypothetical protein